MKPTRHLPEDFTQARDKSRLGAEAIFAPGVHGRVARAMIYWRSATYGSTHLPGGPEGDCDGALRRCGRGLQATLSAAHGDRDLEVVRQTFFRMRSRPVR